MARVAVPAAALLALQLAAAASAQQQLALPRPSPNANVAQTIGVTDVSIHYSRPGVKGRTIWGGLVPYSQVWRTGANENTTITFSTPVKIGGTELPAGTYGLQTIPTQDQWTVIFSKDAELWGAFDYKQEHDALRIQATPRPAPAPVERMRFTFENVTDNAAEVVLAWEKLEVPFTVEVDTPKLAAAAAGKAIGWQTPYQAANWCIQNDSCLDDAGRWLEASIALSPNFANQRAKATLLAKRNDYPGAVSWGEKALAAAKTAEQPPQQQAVADLEKLVGEWKGKGGK
ncbi:MAG TPA: DUF2911 domain-containing protein [Thermoanaerobaculia bacterium]|nr:DUF2911 domain-containing protein [Thermoanaerobaculia bacterium]